MKNRMITSILLIMMILFNSSSIVLASEDFDEIYAENRLAVEEFEAKYWEKIDSPELWDKEFIYSYGDSPSYKELMRNPDRYQGQPIYKAMEVRQFFPDDNYKFDSFEAYISEYTGKYTIDNPDLIIIEDCRKSGANNMKLLSGDYILAYGEFVGIQEFSYTTWGTSHMVQCPVIKMYDLDFLQE